MVTTPVPPILDVDRYAIYEPTSPTADFDLGFPLFGEPSDIVVLIDGVETTSFTVRSHSGGAALTPIPVSDAFVRLTSSVEDVTVEIYGGWRPRRTVQASAAYSTREFNVVFSTIIAALREQWTALQRSVKTPYGEEEIVLPPSADLANKLLGFDAASRPVAIDMPDAVVETSIVRAETAAANAEAAADLTAADRIATAADVVAAAASRDEASDFAAAAAAVAAAFGGAAGLDALALQAEEDAAAAAADALDAAASADDARINGREYPTTAAGLSKGLVAIGGLVGGSGGTDGVFAAAVTGDGTGARAMFRVSGGAVAETWVTCSGYGYTTATLAFSASSGLSGASATAVLDRLVGVDEYFTVPATSPGYLDRYRVTVLGTTAVLERTIGDGSGTAAEVVAARSGAVDLKTRIDATSRVPEEVAAIQRMMDWRSPRQGVLDYAVDGTGRPAWSLGLTGRMTISDLGLVGTDSRITGSRDVFRIKDAAGNLIAAWDGPSAHLRVVGLSMDGSDPRLTGSPVMMDLVHDRAGQSLMQVLTDGVDLVPSARLVERLNPGLSTAYPDLFGAVARPGGGAYGRVDEDLDRLDSIGAFYDVVKSPGGPMYLVRSDDPLDVIPTGGQSLAGDGGNTGVTIDTAIYPFACAETYPVSNAAGTTALAAGDVTGFAPASDGGEGGQFPATLVQFAIEALRRRSDRSAPTQGTVGFTAWYGGQSLDQFLNGTVPYANLMAGAARIAAVAPDYKRTLRCPAYLFEQGQSGSSGGTTTRAAYLSMLNGYLDDVLPDLQAALGVAAMPKALLWQSSVWISTGWMGSELAQWDASLARSDTALIGPSHQCPTGDAYVGPSYIQIHPNPLGKMMHAEIAAVAWLSVVETGDWTPCQPTGVTRSGATIDVTFHLPEGNALAFDTDWILAPADTTYNPKGFTVLSGGSPVAITSVSLLASNKIRIVCAADPGPCTVRMGMTADVTPPEGWVRARCTLYSPSAHPSPFAAMGYAVPTPIRHYAIKAELDVA